MVTKYVKISIVAIALILLIFLTSCKTIERIYIYPDFIHPPITEQPEKTYVDGGFVPVDPKDKNSDLIISHDDAQILGNYLSALKEWGSEGWLWITDFYIKELERLKDNLPKEN